MSALEEPNPRKLVARLGRGCGDPDKLARLELYTGRHLVLTDDHNFYIDRVEMLSRTLLEIAAWYARVL
jgi:hypothetical protein